MNLEQLTSYEQEESSRFDQYLKRIERGETGGYPEPERFRRLTEPVGKRATDASLWPQIPLFGSLTVPLFPVNQADFSKTHRFDVADLPRLVELCKESGHVQFILAARPTMFAGLDYLDVVLQELAPPVVRSLPSSSFFDQPSIKRSNIQFDTIGSISFWPWFKSTLRTNGFDESSAKQNYGMLREVFTVLNLMGYHKTLADVSDSIVSDPVRAYRILHFYNMFVEGPLLDPTREVYCFSREYVKGMKSLPGPKSEPLQFPFEIGALLLNSLTLAPEKLDACREVIGRYEERGIPALVSGLSSAVSDSRAEAPGTASGDLNAALQGVWEDSKSKDRAIGGVPHAIGLGFAGVGPRIGQLLGETVGEKGLLSELGFSLASSSTESPVDAADSRALGLLSKTCIMAIFNPQKKHRLA
ncbi:MAG: hypothetical protein OK474_09610 [Thaumarchaeota archaeon]|nr:hypothetical protein [Nitrososphaerota archaeon]